MQDLNDALTALGFNPGSNPDFQAVKKRWKDLCQLHHPDKPSGSADAFRRVTHAFKMLTDAEYRHHEREDASRRGNPNIHGALDVRMMVPIGFEDAFFGRKIQFSYSLCRFDEDFKMIPVGSGEEVEMDRLDVTIEPGTLDGYQQLMPGHGHRCGDKRGNALIVVQVLPHPRFQSRGGHIHATEDVPLDVCLRGGTIEVLTMYGARTVKVRAGTKPGDAIRVPSCGAVQTVGFGIQHKGDHIVTVNPVYPTRDELRGKESWKGLGVDWDEEAKGDLEAMQYMQFFNTISTSSTTGGR